MMERHLKRVKLISALLLLVALAGCQTQSLFVPPAHQVHLFKERGEVQAYGSVNSGGFSGNIAFTPLRNVEFFGAYHMNKYEKGDEFQNQKLWEVGFGWYDESADPVISELLFGYGKGSASFFDNSMTFKGRSFDESNVSGSFTRFWAQYNIGMNSKAIDFGGSLRASHLYFPDYNFESFPIYAEFNRYMMILEPVAFANIGYRNIRLEGQIGYPLVLFNQTSSRFNGVTFSAGIKFMFNRNFDWLDY